MTRRSPILQATLLLLVSSFAAISVAAQSTVVVAAPQPDKLSLLAVGAAARYRLSASTDLMLDSLDPASRAAFTRLLRPGGDASADFEWRQLMAGALQLRHERGDVAETLWYNPLFDAGVVVHWRKVAVTWTATDAAPVLGETIRGEPTRAPASITALPVPAEVQALAIRSFKAAEVSSWASWTETPLTRGQVLARVRGGSDGLTLLSFWPGYSHAAELVRGLLTEGNPVRLGVSAPVQAVLTRMGDAARLSLRPVGAYRDVAGWTLALQSPDAPGLVWFARFTNPPPHQDAKAPTLAMISYTQTGIRP